MIHRLTIGAVLIACTLAPRIASADWARFTDSHGTSVQYPRDVFSMRDGEGMPPGPVIGCPDRRCRLHIFTLPNKGRASPSEFIRRAVTDHREHLSYKRVGDRFFVFSAAHDDLILYRRCNFVGTSIHCVDIRYPRDEKRRWDATVTRMSYTLMPR